jgi:hypothetical protein
MLLSPRLSAIIVGVFALLLNVDWVSFAQRLKLAWACPARRCDW